MSARHRISVRLVALSSLVACALVLAFGSPCVLADVTLPSLFADHMVVQRDRAVPIRGWAEPGEKVTATLGDQSHSVTADAQGHWRLNLEPLSAGGPHELVVRGNNTLRIADVLVGEVWLCSGQSNMAFKVSAALNFESEAAAADHPGIRMFTVERQASPEPRRECQGSWAVCSPGTVGEFSATAYFFGRALHESLGVPVGLVNSSWGGTAVEAWTSRPAQDALPELAPILEPWDRDVATYDPAAAKKKHEAALTRWREASAKAKEAGDKAPRRPAAPTDPAVSQNRPANLYNGMIAPLVPYALRGAIWYQGERNSKDQLSYLYRFQLPALIGNWRDVWNQGDFPFLFVQLPDYTKPQVKPVETTGWVMVREAMLKTLATPNTGMAVTLGTGMADNIHPKNKQEVGRRLAQWALGTTYKKDLVYSGPLYRSMSVDNGKLVLEFDHLGGGLMSQGGGPLVGFAIAGKNKEFVSAEAKIEGNRVVVSSPEVSEPAAVRYAWASNPKFNLYNKAGLPASPFRTDEWEVAVVPR